MSSTVQSEAATEQGATGERRRAPVGRPRPGSRVARRLELLLILTRRDILVKYRGSIFGLFWSLINPLFLLTIYTLVFGVVLKMRWGSDLESGGWGAFAVMLFCGLIPFTFCSEVLSRACDVIVGSPNYVKRIAFPTELLPTMVVASALVHSLISMGVLVAAVWIVFGHVPIGVLYVPVLWLPLVLFTAAGALVVSAVGVFVRDLRHIVGLAFAALFFLTPIFYPAARVPDYLQMIVALNPIAFVTVNLRHVLVRGQAMPGGAWAIQLVCSLMVLAVSGLYFRVLRQRFADVL